MIGPQLRSLRPPDVVTLLGLLSAFTAIFLLWRESSLVLPAYFCILVQIFADFWDGRIARHMGIQNSLGVHLDNFSDFLTIFATLLLGRTMVDDSVLSFLCFAFFLIAAAIRLAYFTVHNAGKKAVFLGIPTTLTSLLLSSFSIWNLFFWHLPPHLIISLYFLGGIGMISAVRIPKL